MLLEQINRRTAERLRAREQKQRVWPMTNEGKTIAIKAPEKLYERFQVQMKKYEVRSIKEMVYIVAQIGLAVLENDNPALEGGGE